MSHYATVETQITDEDALVAALEEINPAWTGQIVRDAEGSHLYGYHGDQRPEVANVIIRREHVSSASNDIGFVRGENSRYRAILSDYDRSIGFDEAWLGRVKQTYAKHVVLNEARRTGLRMISETSREDGSIKLVLEV